MPGTGTDQGTPCPQAWHGGLTDTIVQLTGGTLVECVKTNGHRGQHRNTSGDMRWSGSLTDIEHERAAALRQEAAA